MATTKKPQVRKKAPAAKKPAATKQSRAMAKTKVRAAPLTWRFYVVTIGIFVVAVSSVIVMALLTASTVHQNTATERLGRIQSIYTAINPGDGYQVVERQVFGEKRTVSTDPTRTYPSIIEYLHADTVNNTVADLDAKIKAAGFAFVAEPHPQAAFTQYTYKSSKGEYIRLTVSSKPYDDAVHNAKAMKRTVADTDGMDKNAGPSTVVLSVNLDTDNE